MKVKVLDLEQLVRAAKRITHAAGYLELGLIPQALNQLEGIPEFGPFEAAADLIRGEAFRCQQRHEDAAKWFRQAAHKFANPLNQVALMALSHCLRAALQAQSPPAPGRTGRIPSHRLPPPPPANPAAN